MAIVPESIFETMISGVILIGPVGVGKSTVAKLLAQRLCRGRGHSVYEDDRLFQRVQHAMAPYSNGVLLLSTPNVGSFFLWFILGFVLRMVLVAANVIAF